MLKVRYTAKFKQDLKTIKKRNCNIELLKNIICQLCEGKPLPIKFKEHPLRGNYAGYMECHIQPDWLLIYKVEADILTLTVTRTGTHSDLF